MEVARAAQALAPRVTPQIRNLQSFEIETQYRLKFFVTKNTKFTLKVPKYMALKTKKNPGEMV